MVVEDTLVDVKVVLELNVEALLLLLLDVVTTVPLVVLDVLLLELTRSSQ